MRSKTNPDDSDYDETPYVEEEEDDFYANEA